MPVPVTYHRASQRAQRDPYNDDALTWVRYRHSEIDTYEVDLSDMVDTDTEECVSVTAQDRYGVTVGSISVTRDNKLSVNITEGGNGGLRAAVVVHRNPITLEQCFTMLNDLKAQLNAHAQDGTHHAIAALAAIITSADATTFAEAKTLVDELRTDFNTHRTVAGRHFINDEKNVVTAAATPATLAAMVTLIKDIREQYLDHIEDKANGYHASSPDSTNTLTPNNTRTMSIPLQWRLSQDRSLNGYDPYGRRG